MPSLSIIVTYPSSILFKMPVIISPETNTTSVKSDLLAYIAGPAMLIINKLIKSVANLKIIATFSFKTKTEINIVTKQIKKEYFDFSGRKDFLKYGCIDFKGM